MRHRRLYVMVALLACPVGAVAAQAPTTLARIRGAMQLPAATDSARKQGASEGDLRSILEEHKRRRIAASEARDVLSATNAGIREHGRVDNFGAFVKSRLDAGLRGRALSQAIRAEHARRGIGKSNGRSSPNAKGAAAKGATTKGATTKAATSKGAASKATPTKTTDKAKTKGRP